MDARLESEEQRMVREVREHAEWAVQRMEGALQVAGLPMLPSLTAGRITILPQGVHIQLGGCNPRVLVQIANWIEDHARCTSRITRGETVPPGLAELPYLPCEVKNHE